MCFCRMTFVSWEKQSKRCPAPRGHLPTPLAAIPLQLGPQTIIPTTHFLRLHVMPCWVWVGSWFSSLGIEGTLTLLLCLPHGWARVRGWRHSSETLW